MLKSVSSQLEALHFSPSEAKVYAALAQRGQSAAGPIIKLTGLHRSVVYECLDKLVARKLVFQLDRKRIATFQITDPNRILTETARQHDIAKELVPLLKNLHDTTLPEITVYEGIESYRQFWLDSVKTLPVGTTDYVAGSITKLWREYMGPKTKEYLALHIKRRIKWKMIVFDIDEVEQELLKKYPALHEYRYIPRKTKTLGNFNVWGGDTLVLHSTAEPLVMEIKHTALVSVFQNIFDILWETGKPIPKRK